MFDKNIILKIEASIKEALGLDIVITVSNGKVIINGLKNDIEEIQSHIFIHGFLYGWTTKNSNTLRLYNPEVG
jgi:uncharacterized protein Veg